MSVTVSQEEWNRLHAIMAEAAYLLERASFVSTIPEHDDVTDELNNRREVWLANI